MTPTPEERLTELTTLVRRALGPAYRVSARSARSFSVTYPNGSPMFAGSYAVVHAYLTGYQVGYDKHRNDFI